MKKILFGFLLFATVSGRALDKVKVASTPALSSAGVYIAIEEGFFKEQGLEIETVIIGNSGAPMTLLLSRGELDVGAGGFTSGLFNAFNSGEKFKIVADKGHITKGAEYIWLVVRKDLVESKKYRSPKDLKGLKIGLPAIDGVSQQVVLSKILQKAGLKDEDVQLVKMSYPEINTALKAKAIDASVQLEPYIAKSLADGVAEKVASANDYVPNQQSAAIFYSPSFAQKKELAQKFMLAYLKGVQTYNKSLKDKALWTKVVVQLQKYIKIEDAKVWETVIPIGLNDDGDISKASLEEDLKWYVQKGFVKQAPKLDELIDMSYAKAASAQLKK